MNADVIKQIPETLLNRLKKIIPEIETFIDDRQPLIFLRAGRFDENLFQRFILDKKRASIYRKVSDKGRDITFGILEDRNKSIIDSLGEFGGLMFDNILDLIDVEGKISKIVGEYTIEKNRGNIEGLRNSINESMDNWSRELDSTVYQAEAQAEAIKENMLEKIRDFDWDKVEGAKVIIENQMNRLKEENRRAAKERKRLFESSLKSVINGKISGLDPKKEVSEENLRMSKREEETFIKEFGKLVVKEIENQRRIRKEMVEGVMKKVLDINSKEELHEYLDQLPDLSEEDKKWLREVVDSDYLPKKDIEDSLVRGAPSSSSRGNNIGRDISWTISQKKRRLDEIYNGKTWHVCNGGWWAFLAHIGTLGFCSGFTITLAIANALEMDVQKMFSLAMAVGFITLSVSVPTLLWFIGFPTFAAAIVGTTLGQIGQRLIVEDVMKQ